MAPCRAGIAKGWHQSLDICYVNMLAANRQEETEDDFPQKMSAAAQSVLGACSQIRTTKVIVCAGTKLIPRAAQLYWRPWKGTELRNAG